MLIFTSDGHKSHSPGSEFFRGSLVPCYELPLRIDLIQAHLKLVKFGEFREPRALGLEALHRVHDSRYLEFIETIHERWCQQLAEIGETAMAERVEIIPHTFPTRHLNQTAIPDVVYGEVGYYAMDTASPITAGTFQASQSATLNAINAVQAVHDRESTLSFSLSRPPGHHACSDGFGGYCFFNHAAVAAEHWLELLGKSQAATDPGHPRIAILDVDFHHCNGTQQIFYDRDDVFVASIHGDPKWAYPYFLGHADEKGFGKGVGSNLNVPLPQGTDWNEYQLHLRTVLNAIRSIQPTGLIVSFGADTHESDPISGFRLATDHYSQMGNLIGELGIPTVVVMEGGYAVNILGPATHEFLQGLEAASS